MENALPAGYSLTQLTTQSPKALLESTRTFCLRLIKETYGYDYRSDWHNDLDSLLTPQDSPYFPHNRGAFFIVSNTQGDIVGTTAVRNLSSRPDLITRSEPRYTLSDENIGSYWRLYVDSNHRKTGLGPYLVELTRQTAENMDYATLYLHCNRTSDKLRRFWESHGFVCYMEDDLSAHYDRPVKHAA